MADRIRCGSFNSSSMVMFEIAFHLPAWIAVRPPCSTYTVQLLINCEVVKSELVFELVSHRDARGAGADDDGIWGGGVCRHLGESVSVHTPKIRCTRQSETKEPRSPFQYHELLQEQWNYIPSSVTPRFATSVQTRKHVSVGEDVET